MKYVLTLVLAAAFGAAGIHARENSVRMTFSGTGMYSAVSAPPVNLAAGGNSDLSVLTVAGDGSLGPFTLHDVSATTAMPTGFGCAAPDNSLGFAFVADAGAFRFSDGNLLTYKLNQGATCIDLTKRSATVIVHLDITGGTGLFQNATGTLTFTVASAYPILFDATGQHPVLTVIPKGVVTGTIVLQEGE